MDDIGEIFLRADIQQIREFLLHGVKCNDINRHSYSERMERPLKKVREQLYHVYPDEKEHEKMMAFIGLAAGKNIDRFVPRMTRQLRTAGSNGRASPIKQMIVTNTEQTTMLLAKFVTTAEISTTRKITSTPGSPDSAEVAAALRICLRPTASEESASATGSNTTMTKYTFHGY